MQTIMQDAQLVGDREDLITVIGMRFGPAPGVVIEKIYAIESLNTLQRLILAAANAPDWGVFLEELYGDESAVLLVGEQFNPLTNFASPGEEAYGRQ